MSLRSRLIAGTVVIALVLIAAAVAIVSVTRDDMVARIDDQLRALGIPVGLQPPADATTLTPIDPQDLPDAAEQPSSAFIGVVEADGTLRTVALPNLTQADGRAPEVSDDLLATARTDGSVGPVTVPSSPASDTTYRLKADYDPELDVTRVIAFPLDDVDAAVGRLVRVEIGVTLAILAILTLVTSWVMRLGVRPIKQMTRTATAIAEGDMSHRVPEPPGTTEAGELGIALNQMLHRIEESFAARTASEHRLRQFIADASHELRTPVTTIRGYAELYRAGALDHGGELAQAMRRTEEEAIRMGDLVDDLLVLARLDQSRPLQRAPLRLDRLVTDTARDARAVDPSRPIQVTVEPVTVMGDEARLRQVLANVVGNALVHTEPGTAVRVRLSAARGHATVTVSDSGEGMNTVDAERAFERFYRADPARSRHHGGSGLGLSIVKSAAEAHGGSATLESTPGLGITVTVRLPIVESVPWPVQQAAEGISETLL